MRSRDGNNYRSLAVCSVIFLNSLTLYASEYLVSYRYVVKDAFLYNESLQISRAMKKCKGEVSSSLELITKEDDFKKVIEKSSNEFIDFVHKIGLDVVHKETTTNAINTSTTILTLKTTCFKVDFNDNLVRISPLK